MWAGGRVSRRAHTEEREGREEGWGLAERSYPCGLDEADVDPAGAEACVEGRVRLVEIFTAAGQASAGQRTVLGENIQTLLD